MAKEIERKFLVTNGWKSVKSTVSFKLKQGYISSEGGKVVRVRTREGKYPGDKVGYITIKSPSKGISRDEYEYEIPFKDAKEMLSRLCIGDIVAKTRHLVKVGDFLWEIDVFSGKNRGLVVAEIELDSPKQKFPLPTWVKAEVTDDRRYSNSNLSKVPYSKW